ncbi:MAG: GIY-YIG nuclease family protein [Ignavibacteriales bacterium]|nr:GIY-YIG nuclease family protein [Ignavibacteriales bacterium]
MYILQSLKDGRYYIGSTSDVRKRFEYHNTGRTGYTKKYQPWVLIYFEEFETRAEAVRREKYLKSQKNIKRFLESVNVNSVG